MQLPCRIENVFLHEIGPGQQQLFACVTKTVQLMHNDTVLDCPTLQLTEIDIIVGLPAIHLKKIYIVPMQSPERIALKGLGEKGGSGAKILLQVDADIDFL